MNRSGLATKLGGDYREETFFQTEHKKEAHSILYPMLIGGEYS
jgi:hypothetical protein